MDFRLIYQNIMGFLFNSGHCEYRGLITREGKGLFVILQKKIRFRDLKMDCGLITIKSKGFYINAKNV